VSPSGNGFWGVGNLSKDSSIYVEYCLLTGRTLDEENVVTMLDSGPTDLLRSKLKVGVGFLLHSAFTKTLLRANDDCRHFGAVLTDITYSRDGSWDLWLSFYLRG
jgi:hypothetical protein